MAGGPLKRNSITSAVMVMSAAPKKAVEAPWMKRPEKVWPLYAMKAVMSMKMNERRLLLW